MAFVAHVCVAANRQITRMDEPIESLRSQPYKTTYPGLSISLYEWAGWHVVARLTADAEDDIGDITEYPADTRGEAEAIAANVSRYVEANGELPAHMSDEPFVNNPWGRPGG